MVIDRKQTVLIVDDSRTNIMALADLLKEELAIKVATNGKDALRIAFAKEQPDMILLDVMMPNMDGYEVCKQLKEAPETKDIPIIFITAMDQMKDEEYGLSIGAIDYITKPFSPPIVKVRVKNHLELKKYRDLLKQYSMIDGLTGIPNRRRFDEALQMEWSRARRYEKPISLLMLDIDYFKAYNDTYGHLEGDECLRKVAATLQNGLKRSTDMVARWGGEEFACLLTDIDHNDAVNIAEELRTRIANEQIPHEKSTIANYVTISVGVATVKPNEEENIESLLKKADEGLYKAKQAGRNQVGSIM